MSIFRRGKRDDRPQQPASSDEDAVGAGEEVLRGDARQGGAGERAGGTAEQSEGADGADAAAVAAAYGGALPEQGDSAVAPDGAALPEQGNPAVAGRSAADVEAARAAGGPFDRSEVDDLGGRLDLGSLLVSGIAGMELRLELDEATQQVLAATAVLGESAVQLQAFAAPKSSGVWDGIRTEIADSVISQGGTAQEEPGVLGTELRTRMPSAGPDGRTVYAPARFLGVDGPRWFLRAVFSGRAAIDEAVAAPLLEVVRGTVVVRGQEAMAPRELLPLRLPEASAEVGEAGEAGEAGDAAGAADAEALEEDPAGGSTRRSSDLKPFERGPEITEVR